MEIFPGERLPGDRRTARPPMWAQALRDRCGGGRCWPSTGLPCQAAAAAVGPPSEGRGEAAAPLRRDPGSFGHIPARLKRTASRCSRDRAIAGLGRQARRAGGAPLNDCEENPHGIDIITTSWLLDRLFGPIESGPDGAAGVVAVDAPFVGEGAHDVQSVMPGRIDHGLVPRAAVILDFDSGMEVWDDDNSDGEGAPWKARAAGQHWRRVRRRRELCRRLSGNHPGLHAGRPARHGCAR